MEWLFIAVIVLVLAFGFVVFFGAPYLPTLSPQMRSALDLIDLKPGDHLLELGSGDGRVLVAAAKRGLIVTGYELNPFLVLIAWLRTAKYRGQVTVKWGNFWRIKLPDSQGIFVFLLPKYMAKLDKKIVQDMKLWPNSVNISKKSVNPASHKGSRVKLVSFAFAIPNKAKSAEKDGVYLYQYS